MSAGIDLLDDGTGPRQSLWQRFATKRFLFISIAVHVLLGLFATAWVVQSVNATRKLTFKSGPPSPNKATRAMEHKVQMAKKQNTMSAPAVKRIVTTGISKVTLPAMPAMPSGPQAPTKMIGAGGSGLGAGPATGTMGAAGAAGGGPVNFFGMRTNAKRVAFLVDYSGSMSGGFRTRMEQELEKCLKELPAGTQVLIIPWSGGAWLYNETSDDVEKMWVKKGNYDEFELVPGAKQKKPEWTTSSKDAVVRLMNGVRAQKTWAGGTAWRSPFNLVMQATPPPDTIFFLTDSQIPGKSIKPTLSDIAQMLSKGTPPPKVFALWIASNNDPHAMKDLATATGGEFRALEKEESAEEGKKPAGATALDAKPDTNKPKPPPKKKKK